MPNMDNNKVGPLIWCLVSIVLPLDYKSAHDLLTVSSRSSLPPRPLTTTFISPSRSLPAFDALSSLLTTSLCSLPRCTPHSLMSIYLPCSLRSCRPCPSRLFTIAATRSAMRTPRLSSPTTWSATLTRTPRTTGRPTLRWPTPPASTLSLSTSARMTGSPSRLHPREFIVLSNKVCQLNQRLHAVTRPLRRQALTSSSSSRLI